MKIKHIAVSVLLLILFALCVCSNLNILPFTPSTAPEQALPEAVSSTVQNTTQPTESNIETISQESSSTLKTETSTKKEPVKESATKKKDNSVITISIYCSCKNAINSGIRAKKSHLPENGIIINTTVTVKKGSSALAAIKEACSKSGIKIDEKRGYIRGINDLYEKDCGGSSGWMYSVNGTFPNVSSDKYTLNSGDRIELHYTVNLGDVG